MEEYLLVDGYNIINSWPLLHSIAADNLEHARMKLIEILQDYQGYRGGRIIIVFDAHLTKDGVEKHEYYGNLEVVYTKTNETADNYIERWVNTNAGNGIIRVATSDYLQQVIVLSRGGTRMSARDLYLEVAAAEKERNREYLNKIKYNGNSLGTMINPSVMKKLERWRRRR